MRTGKNPQKEDHLVKLKTNHRVIMVIFIPELSGYYENMYDVLKLSLKSLIKSLPGSSAITLVDNGSCETVRDFLIQLFRQKKVDTLTLLDENIGKIDAQIGAARAAREPLITLPDCDILFRENWVRETIQLFNTFHNVSSVAPYPTRRGFTYFTFSTLKSILLGKNKLNFEPVPENFEYYNTFLESINWNKEQDKNAPWPVLKRNNIKAIVGGDHQILTLRRSILFAFSPHQPSLIKVGNNSENTYVDLPIDRSGGLRLSTYHYHAHHMGNAVEKWMVDILHNQKDTKGKLVLQIAPLKKVSNNSINYKL
ncbi:MAG: glycosyltransferase, partial [Leeuwenhoekiella sp.]